MRGLSRVALICYWNVVESASLTPKAQTTCHTGDSHVLRLAVLSGVIAWLGQDVNSSGL